MALYFILFFDKERQDPPVFINENEMMTSLMVLYMLIIYHPLINTLNNNKNYIEINIVLITHVKSQLIIFIMNNSSIDSQRGDKHYFFCSN